MELPLKSLKKKDPTLIISRGVKVFSFSKWVSLKWSAEKSMYTHSRNNGLKKKAQPGNITKDLIKLLSGYRVPTIFVLNKYLELKYLVYNLIV